MNYEAAIIKKTTTGKSNFEMDGTDFTVLVIPWHADDLKRYTDAFRKGGIESDEDSIQYSTDGEFDVAALSSDGTDVWILRDIPK